MKALPIVTGVLSAVLAGLLPASWMQADELEWKFESLGETLWGDTTPVAGLVLNGEPMIFYTGKADARDHVSSLMVWERHNGAWTNTVIRAAGPNWVPKPRWMGATVLNGVPYIGIGLAGTAECRVEMWARNGSQWECLYQRVDSSSVNELGKFCDVTAAGGNVCASFVRDINQRNASFLTGRNLTWSETDCGQSAYPCIDSISTASIADQPAILLGQGGGSPELFYGVKKAGGWNWSSAGAGTLNGKLIEFEGGPAIWTEFLGGSYEDNYSIFERWNGAQWVSETIVSGIETRGEDLALIDGEPAFAYFTYPGRTLHLTTREDGTWVDLCLASNTYNYRGDSISLFEFQGRPALAYITDDDSDHYMLWYAELTPEPATLALMIVGGLGVLLRRKRK